MTDRERTSGSAGSGAGGSAAAGSGVGGSGAGGGTAAPLPLPARPWTLWAAIAMLVLEIAALVVSAVFFVTLARAGEPALTTSLLSLAVMFAILALGLAGVAVGLHRMRRWARPATVAWQVLLILFGLSVLGSGWLLPVASIAPAVLGLIALFAPPTLRAYEAALAVHEENDRAATADGAPGS